MTVKKKYQKKTFLGYSLYTEHWQYKLSSLNCTISSWKIMAKKKTIIESSTVPLPMLDFPFTYESPCKGRDSSCFFFVIFSVSLPASPNGGHISRPWKGHKNGSKRGHDLKHLEYHPIWWLNQPIWKLCSSNWIISSGIGMKIKKYVKPSPRYTMYILQIKVGIYMYIYIKKAPLLQVQWPMV